MKDSLLSRAEFEARLREEGARRYHDRHPFHVRMHDGRLSPSELRAWVENRYYYQTRLPIKDALIVAKSEEPAFRRAWTARILEQDGRPGANGEAQAAGGLELFLRLAAGVGLDLARVARFEDVLPGVRAACDRYVELVRGASLVEAVASSLTECFAPDLMARRVSAWTQHYPWVPREATAYFDARVVRARKDAEHGIDFVLTHATTRELQERCIAALIAKCEILWAMLDAIDTACTNAPRLAAKARLRRDRREARYWLLYPERGLLLNEAAHAVVDLCDGRRSVERIAELIEARYELDERGEALARVSGLLERLAELGVVELGATRQVRA